MPVNTDARGRPLPSVASFRGCRLRLRYRKLECPGLRTRQIDRFTLDG